VKDGTRFGTDDGILDGKTLGACDDVAVSIAEDNTLGADVVWSATRFLTYRYTFP